MLRKIYLSILVVLISAAGLTAQEDFGRPDMVVKASYYDKTPPLRDMPVILPGERDRSWKDGIIGNLSLKPQLTDEMKEAFNNSRDVVVQSSMGGKTSRGPIRSFDGVKNVNGVYPPDTDGDVGPNHYMQMINLSFAIWDKNGNKLYGPVDNSTLWAGFVGSWTGTNDGDPVVLYDELADRWIASQFAINTPDGTYWELIAVSAGPDPLGSWYRYAFEFPAFNDYPKLGVWHDAYYATFNMFGSYTRAAVAAFERDKMLIGDPDAQMVYFDVPGNFSMQPADVDGPAPPADAPCYFAHLDTYDTQQLEIYEFDVDWQNTGNSSLNQVASLAVQPFNADVGGIPQPGTGTRLDDLAVMLMYRFAYRNFGDYEVLLTNHTVKTNNKAGIRWYELRKDSDDWYIYQQGTFAPDDDHRWMGSIAMNENGVIALGYTVSGNSTYPSVRYTGRSPEAPLGEMNFQEMELVEGTSSQSGVSRWGDYSCMSVDPADDTSFWFTQEYMGGGWKTRIGHFDFGPVLPPQIEAGEDTTICENTLFIVNLDAAYVKNVIWETDGDGRFVPDPPTSTMQGYIRGSEDIETGGFSLSVTAFGYEEGMITYDTINVEISRLPQINAGNDTTICVNTDLMLGGQIEYAQYPVWTSNGDGTFSDTAILNPIYYPGPEDYENASVILKLSAQAIAPCEDGESDNIKITFDPCTGVQDSPLGQESISVIPNPNDGSFVLKLDSFNEESVEMIIRNMHGNVVFKEDIRLTDGFYSSKYDFTKFPRGVFFISISGKESSEMLKIILQ